MNEKEKKEERVSRRDKEIADNAADKLIDLIDIVSKLEDIPRLNIMASLFMQLCDRLGSTMSVKSMAPFTMIMLDSTVGGYLSRTAIKRDDDVIKYATVRDATVSAVIIDIYSGMMSGKYKTMSRRHLDGSEETVNDFMKQFGFTPKGEKKNDNK